MEAIPDAAAPEPKPSFFINRNFGLLWVGQAISDLGDVIYFVTLSLWIATVIAKDQPWAPAAVSGVLLAGALPTLTVGPFAGVFVDRWNKRLTMIRMDMIRAILILLLLPLTGLLPLPFMHEPLSVGWQIGSIYLVVIAASICGQFFNPARFTILTEILPEAQRARATAMEEISGSVVKIIGPFLAAPLLFVVGVQWALIVNALSFAVSFIAIMALRVPADAVVSVENKKEANFLRELKEGMSFYRESRLMMTLLISVLIVTLGTGALDALLVFFFQKNLNAPTSLFGTLPMAIGAGSVAGAILAALLVKRLGTARLFWLGLYLCGILLIIFARQNTLWPALLLLLLLGLPLGALNTSLGPLLMHVIPHDLMGRVISVFTTGQTLCNLISISLAGLLGTLFVGLHAQVLGMSFGTYDTIYVVVGLLFMLGAFYAMVNLRGLKVE
ncbi:MAG TPA: MFS transporter [Ktedonosporobacter sp.]|jgi:MFS family permease|nr:MFS transporter [Ktedonosporobacter sp.]